MGQGEYLSVAFRQAAVDSSIKSNKNQHQYIKQILEEK